MGQSRVTTGEHSEFRNLDHSARIRQKNIIPATLPSYHGTPRNNDLGGMCTPLPSQGYNHCDPPCFSAAPQPFFPVVLRPGTVMGLDADVTSVAWRAPYHVDNEFDRGDQLRELAGTHAQQVSVNMPQFAVNHFPSPSPSIVGGYGTFIYKGNHHMVENCPPTPWRPNSEEPLGPQLYQDLPDYPRPTHHPYILDPTFQGVQAESG